MRDHEDLIMELERKRDFSGLCHEAADAIRELVAERDRWMHTAVEFDLQSREWFEKAVNAEADRQIVANLAEAENTRALEAERDSRQLRADLAEAREALLRMEIAYRSVIWTYEKHDRISWDTDIAAAIEAARTETTK